MFEEGREICTRAEKLLDSILDYAKNTGCTLSSGITTALRRDDRLHHKMIWVLIEAKKIEKELKAKNVGKWTLWMQKMAPTMQEVAKLGTGEWMDQLEQFAVHSQITLALYSKLCKLELEIEIRSSTTSNYHQAISEFIAENITTRWKKNIILAVKYPIIANAIIAAVTTQIMPLLLDTDKDTIQNTVEAKGAVVAWQVIMQLMYRNGLSQEHCQKIMLFDWLVGHLVQKETLLVLMSCNPHIAFFIGLNDFVEDMMKALSVMQQGAETANMSVREKNYIQACIDEFVACLTQQLGKIHRKRAEKDSDRFLVELDTYPAGYFSNLARLAGSTAPSLDAPRTFFVQKI